MENEALQIFIELAKLNAEHIGILNREMGEVLAELTIIKWFLGINVVVWLGAIVGLIVKRLVKNGR